MEQVCACTSTAERPVSTKMESGLSSADLAEPAMAPPPPPPIDQQLQPMGEGSAASKLSGMEHHGGAGDEPPFRMEDLPAEILPIIMSLLPLKEAVRNSIVSTSWKMLWTFHCNLCFYGPDDMIHYIDISLPPIVWQSDEYIKRSQAMLKIERDKFIEVVNRVIERHIGVGINNFSIRCGLHKDFDHLDRWISFATALKAKIINFDLKKNYRCPSKVHQFPLEAFVVQGSSCVQPLFLSDASIKQHSAICGFTLLTRLVLEYVKIFGDFPGFLANCPALEDLEMIECSNMDIETVESHAADLAHFEYKGKEIPIVLHGCSKLEKATIIFKGSYGLVRVFTSVPTILGVKTPNVEARVWAYEQLEKVAPRPHGMFMHLRHIICGLTVISSVPNADNGVLQLACCLNLAPQLETLYLDMTYRPHEVSAPDYFVQEDGAPTCIATIISGASTSAGSGVTRLRPCLRAVSWKMLVFLST